MFWTIFWLICSVLASTSDDDDWAEGNDFEKTETETGPGYRYDIGPFGGWY